MFKVEALPQCDTKAETAPHGSLGLHHRAVSAAARVTRRVMAFVKPNLPHIPYHGPLLIVPRHPTSTHRGITLHLMPPTCLPSRKSIANWLCRSIVIQVDLQQLKANGEYFQLVELVLVVSYYVNHNLKMTYCEYKTFAVEKTYDW